MADRDPRTANESFDPAAQTGEDKGRIKREQSDDAQGQRNLPRGSEPETRGNSRER